MDKKEYTTIGLSRDTKNELMLFKIQTNAKNVEEVLKVAIKKLKEELEKNEKKDFEMDQEVSSLENVSEERTFIN